MFDAEPTRTYDLDVSVLLSPPVEAIVVPTPVYAWLEARGFEPKAEHVVVYGVPVRFIPAHNNLVEEAITGARQLDYEAVPVRVTSPGHLVAIASQTGGRKRRERAFRLVETGDVDRRKLDVLPDRHGIQPPWGANG